MIFHTFKSPEKHSRAVFYLWPLTWIGTIVSPNKVLSRPVGGFSLVLIKLVSDWSISGRLSNWLMIFIGPSGLKGKTEIVWLLIWLWDWCKGIDFISWPKTLTLVDVLVCSLDMALTLAVTNTRSRGNQSVLGHQKIVSKMTLTIQTSIFNIRNKPFARFRFWIVFIKGLGTLHLKMIPYVGKAALFIVSTYLEAHFNGQYNLI